MSHPSVVDCCVVGMPDALKGHKPFAFISLSEYPQSTSLTPNITVTREIQALVRNQIAPIANLGGILQGQSMLPRTRSGKILRRVLRDLIENAWNGEIDKTVDVPATIEDVEVVDMARERIRQYFNRENSARRAMI
jgi:propionyl-CoA synthetase